MSRLLDDDQDLMPRQDRELTLSTGAILAIFLGLVLLCGVFFGFGYNLGRKSTTIATANATASSEDTPPSQSTDFDNFKPAAAPSESKPPAGASAAPPTPRAADPEITSSAAEKPAPSVAAHAQPAPRTQPHPAAPAPPAAAAEKPPAPAVTPGGAFVVQVAAISRKDDADMLVSALRAKGYEVAAHPAPQDKLLHIQVGPFATKPEAEEMRKRLLADGYNAILK